MSKKRASTTTTTTAGPALTAAGAVPDVEGHRARAVQKAQAYIQMVDMASERTIGSHYWADEQPRPEYRAWHVVRCGMKSSPQALALRQSLCNRGYTPCEDIGPLMMSGFERAETMGNVNLFVMAPPQVRAILLREKAQAIRRRDSTLRESFGGTLDAIAGNLGPGAVQTATESSTDSAAAIARVRASLSGG